jgi:hypothetical protein
MFMCDLYLFLYFISVGDGEIPALV